MTLKLLFMRLSKKICDEFAEKVCQFKFLTMRLTSVSENSTLKQIVRKAI